MKNYHGDLKRVTRKRENGNRETEREREYAQENSKVNVHLLFLFRLINFSFLSSEKRYGRRRRRKKRNVNRDLNPQTGRRSICISASLLKIFLGFSSTSTESLQISFSRRNFAEKFSTFLDVDVVIQRIVYYRSWITSAAILKSILVEIADPCFCRVHRPCTNSFMVLSWRGIIERSPSPLKIIDLWWAFGVI